MTCDLYSGNITNLKKVGYTANVKKCGKLKTDIR